MPIENKPNNDKYNPDQRNFKEILSLNDNGDELIKLLNLDNIKASKDFNMANTLAYGNWNYDNFKMKMGFVDTCISGYEKQFGQGYKKYPIVDLGSGGNPFIAILGQKLGLKGLVAVDVGRQIESDELKKAKNSAEYIDKNFPLVGFKIDMLEFVKQLPDNSCNVSMFSIDSYIIKSDLYALELMKQIKRINPDEGFVISFHSKLDVDKGDYSSMFDQVAGVFFKKRKNNS